MAKNNLPEVTRTNRICAAGQITDLSSAFSLGNYAPFSIYLRPKATSDEVDELVKCRLMCGKEHVGLPVPLNDWSPLLIAELSADNAELLETYDIFWGSGIYSQLQ